MLNATASPLQDLLIWLQRPVTRVALLFAFLICASAVAAVHASHQTRLLFAQLEDLRQEQDALLEQRGRLLLERSAFSAYTRVERLATEDLDMHVPAADDTELVQP